MKIVLHPKFPNNKDNDRNMYYHQRREECPEIPVICFVMENIHTQCAANAPEQSGSQKQCPLRNTSFMLAGPFFIDLYKHESHNVHDNYNSQENFHHEIKHIL